MPHTSESVVLAVKVDIVDYKAVTLFKKRGIELSREHNNPYIGVLLQHRINHRSGHRNIAHSRASYDKYGLHKQLLLCRV